MTKDDKTKSEKDESPDSPARRIAGSFVLNVPESERRKEKSTRDAEPYFQSIKNDFYRKLRKAGFVLEIIGVVVVAAYATISALQWNTSRKQLEMSERPWLSADVKILGPLTFDQSGNGSLLVLVTITNTGHSPASYVFDDIRFVPMGVRRDRTNGGKSASPTLEADRICAQLKSEADNPNNKTNNSGYTLFPNAPAQRIQPLQLPADEIKEALEYMHPVTGRSNFIIPYIIGCVDYGFVFEDGRHQTRFSRMVNQIHQDSPLMNFAIEAGVNIPIDNLRLTFAPPNLAN